MEVLMTFLYILLFLVFLSVLIIIHELGHLAAAKAFRVYCLEYSIGMGPLIFKHKRKNGETQFSLRAIPFGGYVSMYGEGVALTRMSGGRGGFSSVFGFALATAAGCFASGFALVLAFAAAEASAKSTFTPFARS